MPSYTLRFSTFQSLNCLAHFPVDGKNLSIAYFDVGVSRSTLHYWEPTENKKKENNTLPKDNSENGSINKLDAAPQLGLVENFWASFKQFYLPWSSMALMSGGVLGMLPTTC